MGGAGSLIIAVIAAALSCDSLQRHLIKCDSEKGFADLMQIVAKWR